MEWKAVYVCKEGWLVLEEEGGWLYLDGMPGGKNTHTFLFPDQINGPTVCFVDGLSLSLFSRVDFLLLSLFFAFFFSFTDVT